MNNSNSPLVLSILATALSLSSPTPASAAGKRDAQAIANAASLAQYYGGNDGRAMVRLKIVDGQGRTMRRQFVIVRRDVKDGGLQQFLVRFEKPADVRDTVFLVTKKPQTHDDRWLYLPALDLVKRIAASDERTSFVGSHIFYEDISGRSPGEDHHRVAEETKDHWILESTPKHQKTAEFARYRVKIRKKDNLPEAIEYFDAKNKAIRRITAARIETINGVPTITRMKAEDLTTGGYTLAAFAFVNYNIGVPDDIFVERSLRHPPRTWLRAR